MDELAVAMKARDFIAKCPSACTPRVDRRLCRPDRRRREIRGAARKRRCVVGAAPERQVPHLRKLRPQRPSPALQRLPRGGTRRARNRRRSHRSELELRTAAGRFEIACDIFAAELLLPYKLFKPRVDAAELGFAAIGELADEFDVSPMSTGSRFATFSYELCAFVLSEGDKVRYSSRSTSLARRQGLDQIGLRSVEGFLDSARVRAVEAPSGPGGSRPRSMVRRLGP